MTNIEEWRSVWCCQCQHFKDLSDIEDDGKCPNCGTYLFATRTRCTNLLTGNVWDQESRKSAVRCILDAGHKSQHYYEAKSFNETKSFRYCYYWD